MLRTTYELVNKTPKGCGKTNKLLFWWQQEVSACIQSRPVWSQASVGINCSKSVGVNLLGEGGEWGPECLLHTWEDVSGVLFQKATLIWHVRFCKMEICLGFTGFDVVRFMLWEKKVSDPRVGSLAGQIWPVEVAFWIRWPIKGHLLLDLLRWRRVFSLVNPNGYNFNLVHWLNQQRKSFPFNISQVNTWQRISS